MLPYLSRPPKMKENIYMIGRLWQVLHIPYPVFSSAAVVREANSCRHQVRDACLLTPRSNTQPPYTLHIMHGNRTQAALTKPWASLWEHLSSGFLTRSNTNWAVQPQKAKAWSFGFRKWRDSSIHVAITKMLISCTVSMQLICILVFACFLTTRPKHNNHRHHG